MYVKGDDDPDEIIVLKGWAAGRRPSAHRPSKTRWDRRVYRIVLERRAKRELERNPFTEMVSGVLLTKNDVKELERRKAKKETL